MPSIDVRIEWDVPNSPHWLNPIDLELILAESCPNTAFNVDYLHSDKPTNAIREEADDE